MHICTGCGRKFDSVLSLRGHRGPCSSGQIKPDHPDALKVGAAWSKGWEVRALLEVREDRGRVYYGRPVRSRGEHMGRNMNLDGWLKWVATARRDTGHDVKHA